MGGTGTGFASEGRRISESEKRNREIADALENSKKFVYKHGTIYTKQDPPLNPVMVGYSRGRDSESDIIVIDYKNNPLRALECEKLIEFCKEKDLEYKEVGISPFYISEVRKIGERNIQAANRLEARE